MTMDLVQCPDCDAMNRPDARYCSTCARNITAERVFVRALLVGFGALIAVVAAGLAVFWLYRR